MRIITGCARGVRLETLEGDETRPTPERVKEALFSMIQFDIEGRETLDLFGGSGQLGLEALSRGAARATFTDSNPASAELIKRNAQKAKLFDRCRVLCRDWESFVRGVKGSERFGLIFIDPPYASKLVGVALRRLTEAELIADHAMIFCETDEEEPVTCDGLTLLRHNRYGKVFVTLLTKEPAP